MVGTVDVNAIANYKQTPSATDLAANLIVTAAKVLTTDDTVIECTANTATDDYNITLPSVSAATGRFYSISATLVANSKAATVIDAGDSIVDISLALDTTGDRAVFFSNGRNWFYFSVLT